MCIQVWDNLLYNSDLQINTFQCGFFLFFNSFSENNGDVLGCLTKPYLSQGETLSFTGRNLIFRRAIPYLSQDKTLSFARQNHIFCFALTSVVVWHFVGQHNGNFYKTLYVAIFAPRSLENELAQSVLADGVAVGMVVFNHVVDYGF